MRVRLQRLFEDLRDSYWFLPTGMALLGAVLAFATAWLDASAARDALADLPWMVRIGPSGAREVLSTVAGSAISVASVVFSISIVALSLASNQFGPRLLRNFMRHGASQIALGTFIATYLYALLVLARVPEETVETPVPLFSVALGLALGIASFAVLIYFIQHVATFIRAPRIIDDVSNQLLHTLEALLREEKGEGGRTPDEQRAALPGDFEERARPIAAPGKGYVQAIDVAGLVALGRERDLCLRLLLRQGHFAAEGQPLALVAPGERVDEEVERAVGDAFVLGAERTPTQDVEFAVDQLVEIAVRALSPGVNDPFTAVNCVDQLGAALRLLAGRDLPDLNYRDAQGRVRVAVVPFTYAGIVDAAFQQIRQHAAREAAVTIRLLEVMRQLVACRLPGPLRAALERQARLVYEGRDALSCAADREDVAERYRAFQEELAA